MIKIPVFILVMQAFVFCTETKTENKVVVKKEKECKEYSIEDIPIRSLIGMSSGSDATYYFIVNDKISKCIWQNHTKEEIRTSYYKSKGQLNNDQLILYFTLFGIMKDSIMLPELRKYVLEATDKSIGRNNDLYFFATTSIDEIEGIKPSIIEIEPERKPGHVPGLP